MNETGLHSDGNGFMALRAYNIRKSATIKAQSSQKHHSAGPLCPKDSIPVCVSKKRQKGKIIKVKTHDNGSSIATIPSTIATLCFRILLFGM